MLSCQKGVTRQRQEAQGWQLKVTASLSWSLSFLIWKLGPGASFLKSCQQDGATVPDRCSPFTCAGPSSRNALPGPLPSRSPCSLLAKSWQLGRGLQDDAHPPLLHPREGGPAVYPKPICLRPGMGLSPKLFSLWSLTPHYPWHEHRLRLQAARGG